MKKLLVFFGMCALLLVVACEGATTGAQQGGSNSAPIPTPTAVPFTSTTFKVAAGSTYEIPFDVQEGTVIEYRFEANLDFNFSVLDPLGNVVARTGRVIADQGRVRADKFGRYTLLFDNSFSFFASKTVTIEYRVVPPGGR